MSGGKNAPHPFVTLSPKQLIILRLMVKRGAPMFGLEIVAAAGGQVKRGGVYVQLQRMEERRFVSSEMTQQAPDHLRRRYYEPTELGRAILVAYELMLKAQEPAVDAEL